MPTDPTPLTTPSEASPPEASETTWLLPRTARGAHRARALVRDRLRDWKVDDDTAFTLELLLAELAGNAVRHARTPSGRGMGVRLLRYGGRLRVEIVDADTTRPLLRDAADHDEHGRGLVIVATLAARWGCCPRRHGIGKSVWAEIAQPDPPGTPGAAKVTVHAPAAAGNGSLTPDV